MNIGRNKLQEAEYCTHLNQELGKFKLIGVSAKTVLLLHVLRVVVTMGVESSDLQEGNLSLMSPLKKQRDVVMKV